MDPKILINVVLALLIGSLTAYIAKKRGRDIALWFVLGAFFQFLALIVLLLLPNAAKGDEQDKIRKIGEKNDDTITIRMEKTAQTVKSQKESEQKAAERGWFYLDPEHKQFGPVGFTTLKELWKGQKVTLNTYLWQEGMSAWKRISELPYLQNLLQE